MTEDQDNAGEVVASAVRVALTAAGQLAEQAARRREADVREAERNSAARVATLQSQLAAERELALRAVRDVVERGNEATAEEVVHAWEQARSWDAPTMAVESARLEDSIRERFGVDAPGRVADQPAGGQISVTTLIARDVGLQADDAQRRSATEDRVAALHGEPVDAGINQEAEVSRALAAQSFPTQASQACRTPQDAPTGRARRGRHRTAAEIHSPGR